MIQNPQNNNNENNKNNNKIIFEKPIKNSNGQININELNQTLEFLDKIFENYSVRIKKLENIYIELKEIINIKNDNSESIAENKEKNHNPLNEFFKRLDNLLENEEKVIPFLNRLKNNEYENSITGESYTFFSKCLDYIIEKILPKINEQINSYRKEKEDFLNSIKAKEKIINFLNNFYKKIEVYSKNNY